MNRQILLEPLDLRAAIEAEDGRVAQGWGWDWHYVRCGLYARQLRRYYERFDPRADRRVPVRRFPPPPLETARHDCNI